MRPQSVTSQLRTSLSATDARNGNLGLSKNEVQLSTLGWTSAAAYYLGFARLNGRSVGSRLFNSAKKTEPTITPARDPTPPTTVISTKMIARLKL